MSFVVVVDVEACGPSPYSGTMTEFGAVAINAARTGIRDTFHGVLVEAVPDFTNPAIPYIAPGAKRYDHTAVMTKFHSWLIGLGERVIFVSDNPLYDGMWVWDAFDRAGLDNPFGHSGRRIADFAAGLSGQWGNTQKWKHLRRTPHDHNPVNDAMGNAEALLSLWSGASA